MNGQPFRVGILGGMGPLAGIELHRLITEATPATRDQDHIQVVLFTNPTIPDRTQSLAEDDGESFAQAAGASVAELERLSPNVIVMACMTAHSRLRQIQAGTSVPILSGLPLVYSALSTHYRNKRIALLATPGSINAGVYTAQSPPTDWLIPDAATQQLVTDGIYSIKAGEHQEGLERITHAMKLLKKQGAEAFILGCTELGLLYAELQEVGYTVVDPLRLIAQQIVILDKLHRSVREATINPTTANTKRHS